MYIGSYDSEDCRIAVEAAIVMSKRWRDDAAIMPDLSVKRLRDISDPPLEIIRYNREEHNAIDDWGSYQEG